MHSIFDIADVNEFRGAVSRAFTRENNAGNGDEPNLDGADLVYKSPDDGCPDVYRRGNVAILVADANGPWAVEVSK